MRPPDHVPVSAAQVGYEKLAADLTVRDVAMLPEVFWWSEPGTRRRAARLALTEARRNSADTLDEAWARPRTWSPTPPSGAGWRERDLRGGLRRHGMAAAFSRVRRVRATSGGCLVASAP
jgi:hypothetical protein